MREIFKNEIKKESSNWAYFDHLMFLKGGGTPGVKHEPNAAAVDDEDHRDDLSSESSTSGSHALEVSESLGSPEMVRSWSQSTIPPMTDVTSTDPLALHSAPTPARKRQRRLSPVFQRSSLPIDRYTGAEGEDGHEQDDEDMLFLRSLAPYFKHLPPIQKLRLRGKIENLIADEIGNFTS